MNNYQKTKELCQTFSKGFEGMEQLIMDWGRNKSQLKKPLQAILSIDKDGKYPANYGSYSAANYLFSLMLTDAKAMKKFYTEQEPLLTTKARQALTFWKEHPAFHLFFSVKEMLQDDFLTIEDLLTGENHLLYSKGIRDMQKSESSRNKHYLCLMVPNGECLQTIGILRFNSLTPTDLKFYCSIFEKEGTLDQIINKHYVKFWMLDEISTIPVIMHQKEPVQYIWQPFTIQEFDIASLGGTWETTTKGKLTSFSLEEPDTRMQGVENSSLLISDFPWTNATLYRDTETGEMAINTKGRAAYSLFSSLLLRAYPQLTLPKEPSYALSMVLLSLLNKMNLPLPWDRFKALIIPDTESGKKKESLEPVNRLLQAYSQAKNTGTAFDLKAFCKREAMDLTEAGQIVKTLEKQFEKTLPSFSVAPEDKGFELSDWPIPSPLQRRAFSSGLFDSELFYLDEADEVRHKFEMLTGGAFTDEIEEEGLPEFVENMFFDAFEYELSFTLMNTFFWILYYKGKEWIPARSYALEMLKLFTYPITTAYPQSEQFIAAFSRFVKKTLCSRGICQLSSRPKQEEVTKGTYTIKATDAFFSFLEPMEN